MFSPIALFFLSPQPPGTLACLLDWRLWSSKVRQGSLGPSAFEAQPPPPRDPGQVGHSSREDVIPWPPLPHPFLSGLELCKATGSSVSPGLGVWGEECVYLRVCEPA